MKHPDPKAHLLISVVKSVVRIVACIGAVASGSLAVLAIGLALAEVVGILEELV